MYVRGYIIRAGKFVHLLVLVTKITVFVAQSLRNLPWC